MGADSGPDHPGGPASPLLSDALGSTHDGIVGYWDGTPDAARPDFPFSPSHDDILYLQADIRARLLDYALHSTARVEGTSASPGTLGVAEISGTGAPLVTIHQPAQTVFEKQLKHMRTYADLRADRISEISAQLGDVISFFGLLGYLDPQRRARTLDLLEAAERLAVFVEMQVKHLCRAPRPVDYAIAVQPMIQTPDHSAFPSGHSTECFTMATVMHRLITGQSAAQGVADQAHAFRLAERMAVNRTVAGVHFPCDSAAGAVLGCALGEHIHALAQGTTIATPFPAFTIGEAAGAYPEDGDFTLDWLATCLAEPVTGPAPSGDHSVIATAWRLAQEEWPGAPLVA